jgi:hypothetical protein
MTDVNTGWLKSPAFLKSLRKISAMPPEQKAVTQTLVDELSGMYAGTEMEKQLQAQRIALGVDRQEHDIKMRTADLDLTDKNLDFAKDSGGTAEKLGYANIALSGLSGYTDMKQRKKYAGMYEDLIGAITKSKETKSPKRTKKTGRVGGSKLGLDDFGAFHAPDVYKFRGLK